MILFEDQRAMLRQVAQALGAGWATRTRMTDSSYSFLSCWQHRFPLKAHGY